MDTVKDILDAKGRDVISIQASQSVLNAIEIMSDRSISALIVADGPSQLAGIIAERDCTQKVVLKDRIARETPISEIMTRNVLHVREDTLVDTCMSLMNQKNIRHLPVVEDGQVVGMITPSDVFRSILKEQMLTIEELESYIFEERGGEGG
jgi:CBS domain-containing protein